MGIMLVYDITNAKSFDNIARWLRNIDEVNNLGVLIHFLIQHASEEVIKMLLGNKCDMTDRRVVSKECGERIAVEHQIRFLETSAKANINIDKAFYDLAEAILDSVSWLLNVFHVSCPFSSRRTRTVRKFMQFDLDNTKQFRIGSDVADALLFFVGHTVSSNGRPLS